MTYHYVLGAPDPEMARIEEILKKDLYSYATLDGRRVAPSTAYKANKIDPVATTDSIVTIECSVSDIKPVLYLDHHRPGDTGYGLPPERYLEASSLGQLLRHLNLEATPKDRLIAAADHCLGHAYRGRCPGVDPEELLEERLKEKAAFQKISYREINQTFNTSLQHFKSLPQTIIAGQVVVDTTKELDPVPEANEVGAYLGCAVLYRMLDKATNRQKTGLIGGEPDTIRVFIEEVKKLPEANGLYGDPERGFAGVYDIDSVSLREFMSNPFDGSFQEKAINNPSLSL